MIGFKPGSKLPYTGFQGCIRPELYVFFKVFHIGVGAQHIAGLSGYKMFYGSFAQGFFKRFYKNIHFHRGLFPILNSLNGAVERDGSFSGISGIGSGLLSISRYSDSTISST